MGRSKRISEISGEGLIEAFLLFEGIGFEVTRIYGDVYGTATAI